MSDLQPFGTGLRFMLFTASMLAACVWSQHAGAEADGSDYYRVRGVAANDVLNIRAQPRAKSEKIGAIPPEGRCLQNLGCEGGLTFQEYSTLTEREQRAVLLKRPRWCRIRYLDRTGWVAGRYLEEDSCEPPVPLELVEESGLNGIDSSTPFELSGLQSRLPGYQLREERFESEGGIDTEISVSLGEDVLAYIEGIAGKVARIRVASHRVVPRVEGRIGDSLSAFVFGADHARYEDFCDPGIEEYSGMVICSTRDASRGRTRHIRHVFAGDWDGPDGELPPLEAARTFFISETLWTGSPDPATTSAESTMTQ